MPDHPDRERLAAFQASDGDRRQRAAVEAHLAGCPACAEVVASVAQARRRLAVLDEPAVPPGLHDRLAAAVEAEVTQQAAANGPAPWYRRRATQRLHVRPAPDGYPTQPAPEQPPAGTPERPHPGTPGPSHAGTTPGGPLAGTPGRSRARPAPWYRRPVAWGAAAALLLAALIVPFLDRSSSNLTTAGGSAADPSQEAATASGATDAASLPLIQIPGEVTAATVRSRLATDSRAKAALDSAAAPAAGTPGTGASGAGGAGAAVPGTGGVGAGGADTSGAGAPGTGVPGTQAATPGARQGAGTQSPDQAGGYRSNTPALPAATARLQPCLPAAAAAADPAIRPLRPAFFIQGSYRGRPATILVTTSAGQPGRVDLWVFPRDTCSSPPLTERVR